MEPIGPFYKIYMDVGGPFYIKQGGRANKKLIKSYTLLSVCLATRPYHIELMIDLSSETFTNALKRFISRRGGVTLIICDNSFNFHGASNKPKRITQFMKSEELQSKLTNHHAFCNIKFKFSPPRFQHFNGLAKRSIKTVKTHLKNISGNNNN